MDLPDVLFRDVFDALPVFAFIVDDDVRILHYNRMGGLLLGDDPALVLSNRAGDVLDCMRAVTARHGCGTGEGCASCVIRNSVTAATKGEKTFRRTTEMRLKARDGEKKLHLVVTVTPFAADGQRRVLLMLEDVSEIFQLRDLIPICGHCKKVRTDGDLWQRVDSYLNEHAGIDFSHAVCPECMEKIYHIKPESD